MCVGVHVCVCVFVCVCVCVVVCVYDIYNGLSLLPFSRWGHYKHELIDERVDG